MERHAISKRRAHGGDANMGMYHNISGDPGEFVFRDVAGILHRLSLKIQTRESLFGGRERFSVRIPERPVREHTAANRAAADLAKVTRSALERYQRRG